MPCAELRYRQMRRRMRRSLYYGRRERLAGLSKPLSEVAEAYFESASPFDYLDPGFAARLAREAAVQPSALVLALVYLDRLRLRAPADFAAADPAHLYLATLLLASKWLHDDGERDAVYNDEWAASAGLPLGILNHLELTTLAQLVPLPRPRPPPTLTDACLWTGLEPEPGNGGIRSEAGGGGGRRRPLGGHQTPLHPPHLRRNHHPLTRFALPSAHLACSLLPQRLGTEGQSLLELMKTPVATALGLASLFYTAGLVVLAAVLPHLFATAASLTAAAPPAHQPAPAAFTLFPVCPGLFVFFHQRGGMELGWQGEGGCDETEATSDLDLLSRAPAFDNEENETAGDGAGFHHAPGPGPMHQPPPLLPIQVPTSSKGGKGKLDMMP